MKLKIRYLFIAPATLLLLILAACATLDKGPFFETPPDKILYSDKEIYNQALSLQYKGQVQSAIKLWKKFLSEHPRSFEALNNLGMAYYSNDQLEESVAAFDNAHNLEPSNPTIKENLRRTLRFRVTLTKENRDYPKAIADLNKMSSLGTGEDKEKILLEIEKLQEVLFKQAETVNTVEAFEKFLNNNPAGIFADKAREKLAALKPLPLPQTVVEKADAASKTAESAPATNEPGTVATLVEEVLAEEKKKVAAREEAPEPEEEIKADEAEKPESAPQAVSAEPEKKEKPAAKPAAKKKAASKVKPKAKTKSSASAKSHQVEVVTESMSLNVRSEPSVTGAIVAKVKKGAMLRVIEEKDDWVRVAYATGKSGWISKKFVRDTAKAPEKKE